LAAFLKSVESVFRYREKQFSSVFFAILYNPLILILLYRIYKSVAESANSNLKYCIV